MTVEEVLPSKVETAGDVWVSAFRRHSALLLRLAVTLVQPADADALVADTLFRVAASGRLVQATDERAYLVRAMVNTAASERRSHVRRERREEWSASAVESRDIDVSAALVVHRALRVLSPQQRAVVFLLYWADMSIRGVADALGISEGSVRRQLARAKRKLRGVLT